MYILCAIILVVFCFIDLIAMYCFITFLPGKFENTKTRLIGFLILVGIVVAGSMNPACADDKLCQEYKNKLKEALNRCDLDDYFALKELNRGIGYGCIKNVDKEILGEYYTKCFQSHIVEAVYDCNLEKLLEEGEIVNNKLKSLSTFTIMREMLRHAKCSEFSDRCFKKTLEKAVANENWSKILEIDIIIDSKSFKICSNHSKLITLVEKAKRDYFRQWIPERLLQSIKKQNLEEIYNLEIFVFQGMRDSPDFQKMREEFLDLKCRSQNDILQNILVEAVSGCNINQILHIENLMLKKWKKNCLDYDYDAMKDNFYENKLDYLDKCFDYDLSDFVNNCDLGRILDLQRAARSIDDSGVLKEVSERKCFDLVECFIEDFEHAVHTCNQDRMHQLETLLKSAVFRKCGNYKKFLGILKQQKQAIDRECIASSEVENTNVEAGKVLEAK
jgi:hypothetical protein